MLGVGGLALILHTGLPASLRACLALGWLLRVMVELAHQARGTRHSVAVRLTAERALSVIDAAGTGRRARLLPGSVVIRRVAWLRIELPNGCRYGELLPRAASRAADWHRLQLIWQQRERHADSA
jgi:hypothetical protein